MASKLWVLSWVFWKEHEETHFQSVTTDRNKSPSSPGRRLLLLLLSFLMADLESSLEL
jgi:hypothetical protein